MSREKNEEHAFQNGKQECFVPLPQVGDAILLTDPAGNVIQVNQGFTDLFGWKEEEVLGRSIHSLPFIPSELREEFAQDIKRLSAGDWLLPKQTKRERKDGQLTDVLLGLMPVRDAHEEIKALASVFVEVDGHLQTKKRLKESEQRYKSLFDYNPHAVFTFDLEGKFTSINQACARLIGYTTEEMMQRHFSFLIVPKDRNRVIRHFYMALKGTAQEYEADIIDRSGQRKNLHIVNSPIVVGKEIVGVYGIATDITKRKKDEVKLERLAFYDQTTGTANRHLFKRDIRKILAEAEKKRAGFALLHLNGDRFKYINDALGMEAGDLVLKSMAERICPLISGRGRLYRLDGDDFYLILQPLSGPAEAEVLAGSIVKAFRRPWQVNSHELTVTASIGIALYPEHGETEKLLIKRSGQALDYAKREGKNMYRFFDPAIGCSADTMVELEMDIVHAIERKEFQLFYQPKMDIETSRVIGAEALIRWNHPEKGLISPDRFIPLAEQNGLIYELTRWVLHEACRQSREWTDQNRPGYVSVNISPHHLYRKDLTSTILEAIQQSGIQPDQLELEITESGIVQDVEMAIQTIKQLKSIGVRISIDDFGTGFSSLSHLKELPVDILKIDRSFIQDLPESEKDQMIVRSIIQLASAMGLHVVAEGVEEEKHLTILKEMGCQTAQGYYISRPVPNEAYINWLAHPPLLFKS
ncbi:sensor domain-containing protein [Domibacillus indicus]|uniref:sensor domain-containing protein n=1 Tax=Domibacillus indicus TaxID=1437523 RepID=UPI000698E503|nr:bifunctional diguanylate cyclase/phosphodiesterase [Domibacillus indicus]